MRSNIQKRLLLVLAVLGANLVSFTVGGSCQTINQEPSHLEQPVKIPVATGWTLEAAGAIQQNEIKSVVLLECPQTHRKGSGFLVSNGLVVTNNHVLSGCTAVQMIGTSSLGVKIHFARSVTDDVVDLALLKPVEVLQGGLHLADDVDAPTVGSPVSIWGYPLQFNGPAPLLSNGYIAGFLEDGVGVKKVKHIVINGAINPGNSGGPVFKLGDDKVIGIVVAKFLPYSNALQKNINTLANIGSGLGRTYTYPDGTTEIKIDQVFIADMLQEIYDGTQVMIGEAISVSELKSLISRREVELK